MNFRPLAGTRALVAAMLILTGATLSAAQPSSGTLTPASNPLTWSGSAPGGTSPEGETTCVDGVNCESFTLTLSGTPADWSGKRARVRLSWLLPATDYDMYVHKDSLTGPEVQRSAEGTTTFESVDLDPNRDGTGVYVVRVVYWAATALDQYSGTASVEVQPIAPPPPPPSTATPPSYGNFPATDPLGKGAGEPTLGNNWASGNTMFIAGLETLKVTFNDSVTPATASWVKKSAQNTSITSFDPILFTDSGTNRTFVSQLLPAKVSLMAFTDNDGDVWTPSMGAGINSGVDHQTVGGGPFRPNVVGRGPLTTYPNAVYYASQDIGLAEIAMSRDGGMTFDLAIPMWNLTQCGGLHGHIKVAPDGTVYVPNKSCLGEQGFAVSEDNGLTWQLRTVPGSSSGETDPSLGIATDGTVYFAYANGDGTQRVAVTRDRGLTWSDDQNVGLPLDIKNSVFPAATAGDPDRAAVFFLGSTTGGSNGTGTDRAFAGTWYGYISTTYDGGKSWVTVNATGSDPVQRGVICTQGTTCPSGTRNLLDFNDLEIDSRGRPLAALADGCISDACRQGVDRSGLAGTPDGKVDGYDNDGAELATILRQASGRTLFAAYDEPNAPSALTATLRRSKVTLTWTDNSMNESQFEVERSTSETSGYTRIGSVLADTRTYLDSSASKKTVYYYRVRATNANGASTYSNAVRVYVK